MNGPAQLSLELSDNPIEAAHDRLAGVERTIAYLWAYGERAIALTQQDLEELAAQVNGVLTVHAVRLAQVPYIDRWGAVKGSK